MFRRFSSSAIALFLSAVNAGADDISIKLDEIGAGSYMTRKGMSDPITFVYRGGGPDEYVIDLIPGSDPTQPATRQFIRDAAGNMVRQRIPNRQDTVWTPHNCERVVGTCAFTITSTNGRENRVRITAVTENGFTFEEFDVQDDGRHILRITGELFDLDEMGHSARAAVTFADTGRTITTVQTHAVYQ